MIFINQFYYVALNIRCEQREFTTKLSESFWIFSWKYIEPKPVLRNVKKSFTCVLVKRGRIIWLYCIFSLLFFFSDWTRRKKIMDYHCPFHLYDLLSGEIDLRTKLYTFSVYFNSVSLLTFANIFWQIPLYGIKSTKSVDHFFHMRVIRASHRGVVLIFDQNIH